MKKPFAALCCVALTALTGCGPSPAQPAPPVAIVTPVPAPPAPAPVPGTPASMLSISAFTVGLYRRAGSQHFQYAPASLEVIETSGTNSATLIDMTVTAEGGRADVDCPALLERIGPGERVDLVKRLGYCMPYAVTPYEVTAVTLTAKFVDERNVAGQLQKTISVQGCTLGGATGSTICK